MYFRLLEAVEATPYHWRLEVHTYSVADFLNVKNQELVDRLRHLVSEGMTHVKNCQVISMLTHTGQYDDI